MERPPIALVSSDARLRLEFHWHEDRFLHRVIMDEVEVACSVEGNADQAWPASPPLQQLSLEEIHEIQTILGVGAAGRSHWSASVVLEATGDPLPVIRFDLAARCRDTSRSLRATYLVADSVSVEPMVGECLVEPAGTPGWRSVSLRPLPSTAAPSDGASQRQTASAETYRWCYRLGLASRVAGSEREKNWPETPSHIR